MSNTNSKFRSKKDWERENERSWKCVQESRFSSLRPSFYCFLVLSWRLFLFTVDVVVDVSHSSTWINCWSARAAVLYVVDCFADSNPMEIEKCCYVLARLYSRNVFFLLLLLPRSLLLCVLTWLVCHVHVLRERNQTTYTHTHIQAVARERERQHSRTIVLMFLFFFCCPFGFINIIIHRHQCLFAYVKWRFSNCFCVCAPLQTILLNRHSRIPNDCIWV